MLLYPEAGLCNNEVSQAAANGYELHAAQHWDSFYRRNGDKFYKDRHYLDREFPDLLNGAHVLLEVRQCMAGGKHGGIIGSGGACTMQRERG